jgi:hypothetical protein
MAGYLHDWGSPLDSAGEDSVTTDRICEANGYLGAGGVRVIRDHTSRDRRQGPAARKAKAMVYTFVMTSNGPLGTDS